MLHLQDKLENTFLYRSFASIKVYDACLYVYVIVFLSWLKVHFLKSLKDFVKI